MVRTNTLTEYPIRVSLASLPSTAPDMFSMIGCTNPLIYTTDRLRPITAEEEFETERFESESVQKLFNTTLVEDFEIMGENANRTAPAVKFWMENNVKEVLARPVWNEDTEDWDMPDLDEDTEDEEMSMSDALHEFHTQKHNKKRKAMDITKDSDDDDPSAPNQVSDSSSSYPTGEEVSGDVITSHKRMLAPTSGSESEGDDSVPNQGSGSYAATSTTNSAATVSFHANESCL